MPTALRELLVANADPRSIDSRELTAALPSLPLGLPMGSATDAMQLSGLLDGRACAALRAAVDAEHERACDTLAAGGFCDRHVLNERRTLRPAASGCHQIFRSLHRPAGSGHPQQGT